jgi:hypothetical protein
MWKMTFILFNKMQHHLITATLFLIPSMIKFLGSGWGGKAKSVGI